MGRVPRRLRALSAGGGLAIAPPALWLGLFFVVPLLLMVRYSFMEQRAFLLEPGWSLENYRRIAATELFMSAYLRSWKLSVAATLLSLAVAYPLAYAVAFCVPPRWQLPLLATLVVPFWTSYVVRTYAWQNVLAESGLVNTVLGLLTGGRVQIGWLYGEAGVVLGFVHFFLMLATLTIYAGLVQIDRLYLHAARDLGASGWQTFRYVVWPLSLPGVIAGALLSFILAFGDYVIPQILGSGKQPLFAQVIIDQVQQRVNLPMAAASGVLLMATLLAAFTLGQRATGRLRRSGGVW